MTASFLVIEDHALLATALARILRPLGHATLVDTAERGIEELRRSREWTALFVDVLLPDGSGLDVLAFAREVGCESPALVLTGLAKPAAINRAYDLRAKFIVKPADPARVLAFAREVTAREKVPNNIAHWQRMYGLTAAEALLLRKAADGLSRDRLMAELDITLGTLKKHVQNILGKTGDRSLASATTRLLRERIDRA